VKIPDPQPDPVGGWIGKKRNVWFLFQAESRGPVPAEASLKLSTDLYGAFRHSRSHVPARVHRVRHMFQSQWIQVGRRAERKLLRDLGVATRKPTRISISWPGHTVQTRMRGGMTIGKSTIYLIDMTKIE
jgi:hypothetical protein